jgi:hypothetical protein
MKLPALKKALFVYQKSSKITDSVTTGAIVSGKALMKGRWYRYGVKLPGFRLRKLLTVKGISLNLIAEHGLKRGFFFDEKSQVLLKQ